MSWAHQRGKRGGSSRKCQHPPAPPPPKYLCRSFQIHVCRTSVLYGELQGRSALLSAHLSGYFLYFLIFSRHNDESEASSAERAAFIPVGFTSTNKKFCFKKKKGNSQPWPPPQTKLPIMQCPQRITFYSLPPAYANVFMAHLLKTRKGRQVWWGSIVGDEHRRIL